ncbi:hypothetical protein DUNSADRAFT_17399 [Dunaliella salina]|uniref:Uncharacterized protein n=1 Tax=Dunaliella salina TaxID=3046 RepID=A0ABQ7G1X1_DUNSA|nr:hypothetical protein DUNSADRAFT_17399 [Dunaliella salina]|eukprot:KAF5828575.1 hypothetical protein DUNSADRAFT_17399 [Dunaliella salina]
MLFVAQLSPHYIWHPSHNTLSFVTSTTLLLLVSFSAMDLRLEDRPSYQQLPKTTTLKGTSWSSATLFALA